MGAIGNSPQGVQTALPRLLPWSGSCFGFVRLYSFSNSAQRLESESELLFPFFSQHDNYRTLLQLSPPTPTRFPAYPNSFQLTVVPSPPIAVSLPARIFF